MGIDKISLTLYDLLGYLLPGYILLAACSIVESSFFATNVLALSRINHSPVSSAIVAYFLGHVSHALGSLIVQKKREWFDSNQYALDAIVMKRAAEEISATFGIVPTEGELLSQGEIYLLADSYIVASGGSAERDVLIARDGFFKASMSAAFVLTVALLSTIVVGTKVQTTPGIFLTLGRAKVLPLTLLLGLLVWLFRSRFAFFNQIKKTNTLRTFLALRRKHSSEKSRPD
jgi:hypothetical protein